ncbi:uncharacterized protein N0V89_008155 [Didymosphaeria variabile]|uniref:Uncharacterized protein n=1 Tax=Didymosphaeria variabile TaxID=1932322 RepID=A0A9W8XF80_9PLEO|nr:uncharacterized protein N0V89_008155 [Didymosphaeria variabile]KAJ4349539.1 hypothetical protein N0V89_008155 [Didymosphaeria variabile]
MPQHRGFIPDAMKISGDNAALPSDAYIPPTSFTPINRPGAQLVTPQHLASSPSTDQTGTTNSTGQRKQHHPIIAQYLGLGASKGPSHLEKLVPALPSAPSKKQKRNRKAHNGSSPTNPAQSKPEISKQRRIPDGNVGFRVTKASPNGGRAFLKSLTASSVSPTATEHCIGPPSEYSEHVEEARRSLYDANATSKRPARLSSDTGTTTLTQALAALTNSSPRSSCTLVTSNASRQQPCSEDWSQGTIAADEFFDDVFDSMDLDSTFDPPVPNTQPSDAQNFLSHPHLADSSATICEDDDFWLSTPELTDDFSSSLQSNENMNACNLGLVGKGFAAHSSVESSNVSEPSGKFNSPVTRKTEAFMSKAAMSRSHTTDRKPIVRSRFPDQVLDRSPIIGLSSRLLLRTSFRVGEAISQAAKATKQGQNLMFELYARVLSSERDAVKQHFVFSDIFHKRPPYLKGEYDAAIWKQVELFNYDSGRFLSKAEMCRCIGQIRRNEKDQTWVMVVLNIWEATWEDIDWVAGIVKS